MSVCLLGYGVISMDLPGKVTVDLASLIVHSMLNRVKLNLHRQEDAHEFICKLMNIIDDALVDSNQNALLNRYHQMFRGTIRRATQCSRCNQSNHNEEHFFILSLNIQSLIPNAQIDSVMTALQMQFCEGHLSIIAAFSYPHMLQQRNSMLTTFTRAQTASITIKPRCSSELRSLVGSRTSQRTLRSKPFMRIFASHFRWFGSNNRSLTSRMAKRSRH